MAFEGGLGLRCEFSKEPFLLQGVFRMSIAKILEDRKTDNMAEVEHEGGVWRDGAFLFPDGSGGSFSGNENYRDSKGVLRFHTVFVSNSMTG